MTLTVGKKVVYPGQGPCRICAVVKRIIDDRPMAFYQLLLLHDRGGELFVPVDKVQAVGIRPLLAKSEIPMLLDQLKQPAKPADNHRQRACYYLNLLASGSALALAEVVEALTELSETKALSFGRHRTLDKAKSLLVRELSEVLTTTMEEAEQQVDEALKARRAEGNLVPVTERSSTSARRHIAW